jgi:hypothetical protein
MAEPDRADLARKATAGLAAINSAKSCSACVEIKITGGVAPGVLLCSSSTKSKPHSLPRSISTSVTSGCNVSTQLRPAERDRATPTTSIPWRSSNRAAASRKSGLSSTITHRNRSPMDISSVWRDEGPAACPLAGSRVLHPSGSPAATFTQSSRQATRQCAVAPNPAVRRISVDPDLSRCVTNPKATSRAGPNRHASRRHASRRHANRHDRRASLRTQRRARRWSGSCEPKSIPPWPEVRQQSRAR